MLLLAGVGCGLASEPTHAPRSAAATPLDVGRTDDAGTRGHDRIGVPAPPFAVEGWIEGGALVPGPTSPAALRGKVVLVRFWTDTCPFCRRTAPALVELDRDFRDRGLVVLGLYHPKPRPVADGSRSPAAPFDVAAEADRIARIAARWGFAFPIGIDWWWRTLDGWWLAHGERSATSATLVIDRQGVTRWVHPGPEFHPGGPADHERCRADYAELRAIVEQLLDA